MIRIQNIYYMLAYAFQVLHEQGYKDVATEDFEIQRSFCLQFCVAVFLSRSREVYVGNT